MRQRITWTRLAAAVHVVQLLLVSFMVEHGEGSAWLLAVAAGFACVVTPFVAARSLLSSVKALGLVLLLVILPAFVGLAGLRTTTERALVVYALGVNGSSLGLSMLACVLALRASSRPVRLGIGTTGIVACAVAAVGALAILPALPLPFGLLLAGPVTWGVVVIAVIAAALQGSYDARDRVGGPRAAFEGANALLLAVGAVALAALASCALHVDIEADLPGARLQHAWSAAVGILRRAAISELPILVASAVLLGGNVVRLGRGARAFGVQSLVVAGVVLALVSGLRRELSRARSVSDVAHHAQLPE